MRLYPKQRLCRMINWENNISGVESLDFGHILRMIMRSTIPNKLQRF